MGILIVDLDKEWAEWHQQLFADYGLIAEITTTVERAYELILASHYKLVITELVFPSKDGIWLCVQTKKNKNIPVVLVTFNTDLLSLQGPKAIFAATYRKPLDELDIAELKKNFLP